jgi:Bacterial toxin homologue of phage lysozyme, C-term
MNNPLIPTPEELRNMFGAVPVPPDGENPQVPFSTDGAQTQFDDPSMPADQFASGVGGDSGLGLDQPGQAPLISPPPGVGPRPLSLAGVFPAPQPQSNAELPAFQSNSGWPEQPDVGEGPGSFDGVQTGTPFIQPPNSLFGPTAKGLQMAGTVATPESNLGVPPQRTSATQPAGSDKSPDLAKNQSVPPPKTAPTAGATPTSSAKPTRTSAPAAQKMGARPTKTGKSQKQGGNVPPPPDQFVSGENYSNVNIGYIKRHEGGTRLKGYVPLKKGDDGKSGVTLADGFDIGQHSLEDLHRLNLSTDLIRRLSPYLQLHGNKAKAKLAKNPLTITADEAASINNAAYPASLKSVATVYDKLRGANQFSKLPSQAQTAISDVYFNFGHLPKRVREPIARGDWQGVADNLRNYTRTPGALRDRTRANARLLQDAIDAKTLPQKAQAGRDRTLPSASNVQQPR